MALDGVDARIPLQAGQNLPQYGPDYNAIAQVQRAAISMQQSQQVQQAQNALKALYGNPNNFDTKTLAPTPDAMARLMQVAPAAGMDLQNNLLAMKEKRARVQNFQTEEMQGWIERGHKVGKGALDTYRAELDKGVPPQAAMQSAQDVYSKEWKALKESGMPPELASMGSPTFDPVRIERSQMTIAQQKAAENLKKEGYQIDTQQTPDGRTQKLWVAPGKPSLDMAGNPITPTGMPKPDKAEEELYGVKVPDDKGGTTEVVARRKPGGGFVNDETGEPLKGVSSPRKIGTKGDDDSGTLDGKSIETMASQYLAGDRTVMQNLGRGAQGSKNIVALRSEIAKQMAAKNMSGPDMAAKMAEYDGMRAGMRTLGTRTANVEMAVTEAQQIAPLVLESSGKVNRTQFPILNSVLQAGERGTGDEDVVRFGIAVNSLINTYARAINPTGVSRVSDIEHARELLSTAWSKGQINAGVDQLMKEMDAARKSPGLVRQEMSGAISGRGAAMPGTEGATAPIPPKEAAAAKPSIDFAVGDSIAEGVASASKLTQQTSREARDRADPKFAAVWGRSTGQVLAAVKSLSPESVQGKTVYLSSGASNSPSELDPVAEQVSALKGMGANVVLAGVGSGVKDYAKVNQRLAEIATEQGVPFTGELAGTKGGRVHPKDYKEAVEQASATPRKETGASGRPASGKTLEVTEEQYDKLPAGAAYMIPGKSTVFYKK